MEHPSLKAALQRRGIKLAAVARNLGVDKGSVSRWDRKVPAERVLDVERVSGIPRHELRPDLYPDDAGAPINQTVQAAE